MKKFILIVVVLVIVWTIWYLVGHVLLGLENVFDSYGLIVISGVIAGFLATPFEMHKKIKE